MVLAGAYPSRELAACCSVDVMKGARGSRFASDSFTSFTVQGLLFPAFKILSTSLFSVGSFSQIKAISSPFFVLVLAVIIQNVCEMNALISLSLSMRMRRAGDWTRPAESPYLTFFQIR